MQYLYKISDEFAFTRRLNPLNSGFVDKDAVDQDIIDVLSKFIHYMNSQDQNKIVFYLKKIYELSKKYDICNHPYFIKNSIFQIILSLISQNSQFITICSACLAISSFSYIFSMDLNEDLLFNPDDLFLILQPEIIFFIFDLIKSNIDKDILSLTKIFGNFCISSVKFRDFLISTYSIDSICQIINYGIENEAEDQWEECLLRLLCDICYFPISEQQASEIFNFFTNFDLSAIPISGTFRILHTIRYIIEKNSNQTEDDGQNSELDWNPAYLLIKTNIQDSFDPLLEKLNDDKKYLDHYDKENIHDCGRAYTFKKYFLNIKEDICGITLSIYLLTEKEFLPLPVPKMIDFLIYDDEEEGDTEVKYSLIFNSLTFFSYFMNESDENFCLCNEHSFFSKLKQAIDFHSAKIRIHAGYVLYGLIDEVDSELLYNLLLSGIFTSAFKLIQLNDYDLSIKMLIVMQKFIQYAIDVEDDKFAEILQYAYSNPEDGMSEILSDISDGDGLDDDENNDLPRLAYITEEMIQDFLSQYGYESKSLCIEEEEEINDEYQFINGDEDDQYNPIFDSDGEINFQEADEFFLNTKPQPLIKYVP